MCYKYITMKFINVDPFFVKHNNTNSGIEFYYSGHFDISIESILYFLENGSFPKGLKGNFAFFYKDSNRVILAVDHGPTVNLYYTNKYVSHVFNELRNKKQTRNLLVETQLKFFGGHSFGTSSPISGISQVEQGTYVEIDLISKNIKQVEYIDLYEHVIDEKITLNTIKEILEPIVEENTRLPFNLLYSSGTDSNCLLGFIRKLKRTDHCNLISLYTENSLYNEKPQIDSILREYNLTTTFYKLGKFAGKTTSAISRYNDPEESDLYKLNFERIFSNGWTENTIWQKFEAVHDTNNFNNLTLTGEVGDELFGAGPTLKILRYIIQKPNYTAREIAMLLLSIHTFREYRHFTKEHGQWLVSISADENRCRAWESALENIEKIWNKIKTDDILNAGKILQYYLMTSWRIRLYTQFAQVRFFHPFQDYRFYFNIFKLPGKIMFNKNGYARKGSYELIKEHVSTLPWEYKKIGPTYIIPEERLNRFRDKL